MKAVATLSLLALLAAPLPAFAGTFAIPSDEPVATVSIPDSWKPKPYEGGTQGTSPDGKVYVAIEMVKADDVGQATEDGIKWFAKQGVEIDPSTMKTKDIKINDLPAFDITMSGKDSDGPAEVSLTLVATNSPTKFLFIYYWGSPEGAKANMDALMKISNSLQATK